MLIVFFLLVGGPRVFAIVLLVSVVRLSWALLSVCFACVDFVLLLVVSSRPFPVAAFSVCLF